MFFFFKKNNDKLIKTLKMFLKVYDHINSKNEKHFCKGINILRKI